MISAACFIHADLASLVYHMTNYLQDDLLITFLMDHVYAYRKDKY